VRSLAELKEAATCFRQSYAEMLEIIADLEMPAGYPRKAALLSDLLHYKPAKATKLVNQAEQISEGLTPTGHVTPAPLPHLREAVRAGLVDGDHIDVIAEVVAKMPDWAPPGTTDLVEKTLVEQAVAAHPGLVQRAGQRLLARIDQDGANPHAEDEQADPVNLFRYRRTPDGRMRFTGDIDAEAAEELANLLQALSERDDRPLPERNGDAFTEVVHLAAGAEDLPTHGGEKPRLTLIMYFQDLIDAVGTATLDSGAELPCSAARRLACDADIIPVVMSGDSMPLDVGRKYRTITPDQRRALVARDMGCAFPGCDRSPRWCDGRHIKWWQFGGNTDIGNLVLLCRRHHRLIHHSEWDVQMVGGRPTFYPPTWVDPKREGVRNTVHHHPRN
jgi:hypothetical protein